MFGIHILTQAQFDALVAAGHQVETFAITEAQKAVLALKNTDVGTAVANDISALSSNSTLTGAEKFESVLANTLPLVLKYATGGGVAAVIKDVEDVGRALVQTIYNDFASSTAGKIAGEILHALHIA